MLHQKKLMTFLKDDKFSNWHLKSQNDDRMKELDKIIFSILGIDFRKRDKIYKSIKRNNKELTI